MKQIEGKTLYDINEIAEKLGVSVVTATNLIKTKKLQAVKFGRRWNVSKENLSEFLDGKDQGGPDITACPICYEDGVVSFLRLHNGKCGNGHHWTSWQ